MSTRQKNKLLIRRYIEEIVNTGNVDDLARAHCRTWGSRQSS